MNKKLFKIIYKTIIEAIFKIIYGTITLNSKYKFSDIEIKISRNKIFNKNDKYYTYNIKNGSVFTDDIQHVAAISNNHLFKNGSFQHSNNKLINIKSNIVLKKGTPKFKKKISGIILSLVQGASGENYFHWLFDILPKIKIASNNYKIKNIDYFYLPSVGPTQIQSLKLLKIHPKKILNSKFYRHIKAEKLIFTDHPWYKNGKVHDHSGNIPKWIIIWLKKNFLKFKKKFNCSKNVYIDRTESKFNHCQIINYKELNTFLEKRKFQSYRVGQLSFIKQIFLFNNASCIIGAHGAAFSNLVFCKPKTKIIELRPHNHPGNNYKRISKVNKLNYNLIISKKKYLNNKSGDIYVDIKSLDNKLKKSENVFT